MRVLSICWSLVDNWQVNTDLSSTLLFTYAHLAQLVIEYTSISSLIRENAKKTLWQPTRSKLCSHVTKISVMDLLNQESGLVQDVSFALTT